MGVADGAGSFVAARASSTGAVAFGINDGLIVAPATMPSASVAPARISVLPWRVCARAAKDTWRIAQPDRKSPVPAGIILPPQDYILRKKVKINPFKQREVRA